MSHPLLLALLAAAACAGKDGSPGVDSAEADADTDADTDTDTDTDLPDVDADGDGHPSIADGGDDCDDAHATVNPSVAEICGDDLDNDCNVSTSEDGTVGLDGVQGFSTIQDALDASVDGSVITVCDGTFVENLLTPRSVTLQSLNGLESTILDGGVTGPVLVASGDEIALVGFTFQNGIGDQATEYPYGGALNLISIDEEATIEDCDFHDNGAKLTTNGESFGYGGAVLGPLRGRLVVRRSTFEKNTAGTLGGAIYAAELEIEDSTIAANNAYGGGGIFIDANSDNTSDGMPVTFVNTEVKNNVSHANGGGMSIVSGSSVVVTGGTFTNNRAELPEPKEGYVAAGGGIAVIAGESAGSVTLADMTIEDNSADYGAGLMLNHVDGAVETVYLQNVTLRANHADFGGGMFAYSQTLGPPAVVTLDESTSFDANTATSGGAGALLYANLGGLELYGGTFENGDTGYEGGALFLYTESGGSVVVDGVGFTDNYGGYGGDIYVQGNDIRVSNVALSGGLAGNYGGSIYVGNADGFRLEGASIESSTCDGVGGAIYLVAATSAVLNDVDITDGAATYGGGVYVELSDASFTGVTISDSSAIHEGGAFFALGSTVTIDDTSMISSSATDAGGALVVDGSSLVATGVTLGASYAQFGGGLYLANGASLSLVDSVVTTNTATDVGFGGGAYLDASSTLASTTTDWGSGASDNTPDDVYISVGVPYTTFGAGATFNCDGNLAQCL